MATSAEHLQKIALSDIAQRPHVIVKPTTVLDAEGLKQSDMDALHEMAIPFPFEQVVPETERQNVLQHLLAKIVVNAEDLFFFKQFRETRVKRFPCFLVAPERLFDDDTRPSFVRPAPVPSVCLRGDFQRHRTAAARKGTTTCSVQTPRLVIKSLERHFQSFVVARLMERQLVVDGEF